jgi:hypothetical protein
MMATTSTGIIDDQGQAIEAGPLMTFAEAAQTPAFQAGLRFVQAPSQLALDNLTETLAALLDEAMSLLGVGDKYTAMANLSLTRVPAAIWHAFPQPAIFVLDGPRESVWKVIAASGRAAITVWCDHRAACPDLPENQVEFWADAFLRDPIESPRPACTDLPENQP